MAEESYREIYLFKKWRVPPIDIVYGSALPITLKFLDYTIPANATIMVYASVDETTVYQQTATASGNAVQFTPGYGFFAVGLNKLQIAINGNKITLEIFVNCQRFLAEGNDPTSTPEAVRPMVDEAREILKETKAVAVKTPYVGDNGNWYVWDTDTGAFKDSGEPSLGATGPQGPQGDPGTAATVTSTEIVYQAGTSGTEAPTGTWSADVPTVPQGQYLWVRVTTQFNTGSPVVYYSVSRFGVDGSGAVKTVNGKAADGAGAVTLGAEDVNARPDTWTPTAAEVGAQPEMEPWKDYILLTDCNNAGAHNAIYRGKNLGSAVTEAQWAAIQAGTFEDLFIGDYWVIGGVNWRIAAFDYYLHTGDTECTAHHAVMVPDTTLYRAQMHNTSSGDYEGGSANTTEGGYVGTDMYKSNLANAKTAVKNAFGSHVLNHREFLTNSVTNGHPSGVSWYDSEVELMNEQMVFGGPVFMVMGSSDVFVDNSRVETSQMPLFRHDPGRLTTRAFWWLRDIVNPSSFAVVGGRGNADYFSSTNSGGVRPVFCIC